MEFEQQGLFPLLHVRFRNDDHLSLRVPFQDQMTDFCGVEYLVILPYLVICFGGSIQIECTLFTPELVKVCITLLFFLCVARQIFTSICFQAIKASKLSIPTLPTLLSHWTSVTSTSHNTQSRKRCKEAKSKLCPLSSVVSCVVACSRNSGFVPVLATKPGVVNYMWWLLHLPTLASLQSGGRL